MLVRDIQDPRKSKFRKQNLYRLLKNNARLIYLIYHQYNYNQTLDGTMSFVYEGLRKATRTYDPNAGAKFYQYAVQATRGILQNYYNYNNDLIHIPVMKRKKIDKKTNKETGLKYELCEVNDFSESQYQYISTEMEDDENNLSNELTMIITEYENQPTITDEIRKEIEIFKLAREYTLKDISIKTGINTVRLRKMIDNITSRLIKFYKKMKQDLL